MRSLTLILAWLFLAVPCGSRTITADNDGQPANYEQHFNAAGVLTGLLAEGDCIEVEFMVVEDTSLVLVPGRVSARVIYVDADANGADDGSSWADRVLLGRTERTDIVCFFSGGVPCGER